MDFGVLQKSSKHFLIYIFFPPFSFRTPPPPPAPTNIRTYFVAKNVLCQYLYTI